VAEIDRGCQADGSTSGISCEMVRVACGLLVSFSEIPFQGEKDVASLPVPVETVDIGIEGVIRRNLRNISMIGLFVGPEIKADGAICAGGISRRMNWSRCRSASHHTS